MITEIISLCIASYFVNGCKKKKKKGGAHNENTNLNDRPLKQIFNIIDIDGDGKISYQELGKLMVKIGNPQKEKELQDMVILIDSDSDNQLDFEEFKKFIRRENQKSENEIIYTLILGEFKSIDKNGDSFINKDELGQYMLKITGENYNDQQLDQMIDEADIDNDDKISFEEFKNIMLDRETLTKP